MIRQVYPRPPIVEAVVELCFAAEVSGDFLIEALGSALADRYSGTRAHQNKVDVSVEVAEDTATASTRLSPHFAFLRSEDGLRLIGCAPQRMSVHVLAPYPGWESFIEQVEEAVAALPEEARAEELTALTVRYIDRVILPPETRSFTEYLTIMPLCPESMPSTLQAFHTVMQTKDREDGTIANLTLASGPSTPGGAPVVIYDLILQRRGEPILDLDGQGWRSIVEMLHKRQHEVFESSITDQTRELFQ